MTGKRPTYTTTHIPRSTMRPPLETTLQILLRLSLLRAVATSDCHVSSPLGMESRAIQDHQISASSYRGSNTPQKARLNWTGAWRANFNNQDQWLQVDLLNRRTVTGIKTQGRQSGRTRFVTAFRVLYSDDGTNWTTFSGDSHQPQVMVELLFIFSKVYMSYMVSYFIRIF
ncbi:EDIL3 [Branchiostoma lanceolatum]|uniref:EDIL3 protein n=1 Tax=Branchiostoma lanceolatum TaxID=7740 RepID=A0A8K0EV18_BRALA|nr:EDIL3 [Branchiostoma lanceolatum]